MRENRAGLPQKEDLETEKKQRKEKNLGHRVKRNKFALVALFWPDLAGLRRFCGSAGRGDRSGPKLSARKQKTAPFFPDFAPLDGSEYGPKFGGS